jgi:hypothetical protein
MFSGPNLYSVRQQFESRHLAINLRRQPGPQTGSPGNNRHFNVIVYMKTIILIY